MSKIVIITSGQPALNPRLVKEADALVESGHEVTVIYAYWNQWGKKFNEILLAKRSWTAICAGGDPEFHKSVYFVSKIVFKLSKLISLLSGQRLLPDWAIGRPAPFLSRMAAKQVADLYIGHNLAALPATVNAAKKHNRPCGFDAEDFHRYEISSDVSHPDVLLKSYIENRYMTELQYLTASSPPIGESYRQLFPMLDPKIVRNVFPKSNLRPKPVMSRTMPVKLFWFSQTLGSQRGLQDVVGALAQLPRNNFELHLLCDQPAYTLPFRDQLVGSGINIRFYDPLPADQIIAFAAQFDVGLATEPGFSINNDLALSNKLFTYVQAGLLVIATATTAQKAFIEQYPNLGLLYPAGDKPALIKLLSHIEQNRLALAAAQQASLTLAHTELNWETEKYAFLTAIGQAIGNR
jgi:hypothetical protein